MKYHYLGHVVSKVGIKPDPAKIEQVKLYPVPTDTTKVRQSVGLASYYRKLYLILPLHLLTRKDIAFEWTPACNEAFQTLKEKLVSAPVPRFAPEDEEFILETDAVRILEPFSHNVRRVRYTQLHRLQGAWTSTNATMGSPSLRLLGLSGM